MAGDHEEKVHAKYETSRPDGFKEDDYQRFSYWSLCKTGKPQGGAIFNQNELIWMNLVEDHKVMLHTKYQSCRLRDFKQK